MLTLDKRRYQYAFCCFICVMYTFWIVMVSYTLMLLLSILFYRALHSPSKKRKSIKFNCKFIYISFCLYRMLDDRKLCCQYFNVWISWLALVLFCFIACQDGDDDSFHVILFMVIGPYSGTLQCLIALAIYAPLSYS